MLFKRYDEKKGILNVEARGNIDYWELLDLYKVLATENTYPKKLKILFKAVNTKFDFKVEYNEDISIAVYDVKKKFEIIKEAFVVDEEFYDPVSLMFEDKFYYDNFSFKIFETSEAAEMWLDF